MTGRQAIAVSGFRAEPIASRSICWSGARICVGAPDRCAARGGKPHGPGRSTSDRRLGGVAGPGASRHHLAGGRCGSLQSRQGDHDQFRPFGAGHRATPLRRVSGGSGTAASGSTRSAPISTSAWPGAQCVADWKRAAHGADGVHDPASGRASSASQDQSGRTARMDVPYLAAPKVSPFPRINLMIPTVALGHADRLLCIPAAWSLAANQPRAASAVGTALVPDAQGFLR